MYKIIITVILITCLLGMYGCSSIHNVGCGQYFNKKSYYIPRFKAKLDDGTIFNTRKLKGQLAILYFGSGQPQIDQPILNQLHHSLGQMLRPNTSLWIFGAEGSSLPANINASSNMHQHESIPDLVNKLRTTNLPALIMVDTYRDDIRWMAQGNNPNLVPDLFIAITNLINESDISLWAGDLMLKIGGVLLAMVVSIFVMYQTSG